MPRPTTTPRPTASATFAPLVHFFMHASVAEATQALDVAKAILASRAGKATNGAAAGATARPKRDRTRKPAAGNGAAGGPTGVVGGTTAAPAAGATPPRKRGRPRRPETDTTAANAVSGAVVDAAAHTELPPQDVPAGE